MIIRGGESGGSVCRFTWASLFFFVNRYLALFGHIPVMLEYFWRIDDQDLKQKARSFGYHCKVMEVNRIILDVRTCLGSLF